MVNKIIGFVGTSSAGKSSASNFLHGTVLGKLLTEDGSSAISNWRLNELGQLEIEADVFDPDKPESEAWTQSYNLLDVDNRGPDFSMWAKDTLWPWIKSFSLARVLKESCSGCFGLTYSQLYGSDKYTNTKYTWGQLAHLFEAKDRKRIKEENLSDIFMTSREFMEYWGSKVLRSIDPDIFVKRLLEQLDTDTTHCAVITDVRRLNEGKALKERGAILVRLLRGNEPNISEVDIEEIQYDKVIDNRGLTLEESCSELALFVEEIGLFRSSE